MKELNRYLPATLALASAVSLATAEMAMAEETSSSAEYDYFEIQEIIVTAQRRSQSIQDVANSVEAITGDVLDELGKVGLDDYISSVGGVGYTKSGGGSVKLGMRGISPVGQTDQYAFAQTVSTVGVYLDDVAVQGAGSLPDLNLYDMQRIEVLKGPQGTLYGDGAMGGAIKMILNKPDLMAFEAKGEVSAMDTEGADIGHRVRGAVNIPIVEDKLAVRLVGSTSEQKGWIDNIATGEDDINDTDSWSLRATALVQINDNFSAELMVMHDEQDMKGFGDEVIGLSDSKTDMLEDQLNDVEVDLYALTLKYDFGFAELTSITSLFEKERRLATRVSLSLDDFFIPFILYPIASATSDPLTALNGLPLGFDDNSLLSAIDEEETFSQELRLVSNGDNDIDWTVGLFYRDRERDACSTFDSPAMDDLNQYLIDTNSFLVTGLQPATTIDCAIKPASGLDSTGRIAQETFEQFSVYGELNWEMTETLELTAGFRHFDEEVALSEALSASGAFATFGYASAPASNKAQEDDILFKLGLSWAPTDHQLYFFNIAEGFRSGGTNLQASRTAEPEHYRAYESDSLINYELGAKTTWLDGKLTLNGAIYYSDWSDVQTAISVPTFDLSSEVIVLTPGGDAEVKGIELYTTYLPTESLLMGMSITYQEAEFTDTIAEANIVEDSDLPNSPDLTVSLFAQYTRQLDIGDVFARVEYRHVDDQRSVVEPESPYVAPLAFGNPDAVYNDDSTILPSYDVTNLTIGLRTDTWYVTGYVNNLFDEHYRVAYGYGQSFPSEGANPTMASVGSPRTVGLTVGTNF